MKTILSLCVILATAPLTHAAAPALTVAAFPLEVGEGLPKSLGAEVAGLIGTHLSGVENLIVLERAQLEDILGEQSLGLSGAITPDSAAKAGALLGAQVLVTGRVFKSGDGKTVFIAKVIGTETGRVFGETVSSTNKGVEEPARQLADKIAATIASKSGFLIAKVETREEWVARVGATLKGKPRPSVSVTIPETHVSQAIPDPAAETEIRILLRELGFPIVETGGEVNVSGEAFSELGLRKGPLVSCRARVEVKITSASKPGEIWNDRETAGGIDLGEQVAAKNALQTAGQRLASRIAATAAKISE